MKPKMTKTDLITLRRLTRKLLDEHPQWTSVETTYALVKALLRLKDPDKYHLTVQTDSVLYNKDIKK